MCCPGEVPIVTSALKRLPGVLEVSVNVLAKTARVTHDRAATSPEELVSAVNKTSLSARLLVAGEAKRPHSSRPPALLVVCGVLWLASFGSHANAVAVFCCPRCLNYAALVAVVVGVAPILVKAWCALRSRLLDINCLMTIAVAGALAIGEYTEGATVVFLFGLSTWLENLATAKAHSAFVSLLAMKPETATRAGTNERIPVDAVRVGDCLAVGAGDKVPVDAVVTEGRTSINESALSGESVPVEKAKGSTVFGGTLNVGGGFLEIRATAAAQDSAVARMVRLIEEAHTSGSRAETCVEAFAKYYTPMVILVAAGFAVLPGLVVEHAAAVEWFYVALVLLVVSCPCALVISTPLTYVSTLSAAATHNVLIRGGEYLEALGSITAIALDKTGTLTEGCFAVRRVLGPLGTGAPGMPRLLALMAAVEQKSTHPLAAALVAHAHAAEVDIDLPVDGFKEIGGQGVEGYVEGVHVQVCSYRCARQMGGIGPPGEDLERQVGDMESSGCTVCYLCVDGTLAAVFGVSDVLRPEAAGAVAALRALGVETVMLTGDRAAIARAIAAQVNIDRLHAELLPEDKVRAVAELESEYSRGAGWLPWSPARRGGIAMVGDGINDAAALAASSVGIAMGAKGSQAAMENASIILMDSDLMKLALTVRLGRLAIRKIKENMCFSFSCKFVMLGLTVAGYASLWAAVVADLGSLLVVTLNSFCVYRVHSQHTDTMAGRSHQSWAA